MLLRHFSIGRQQNKAMLRLSVFSVIVIRTGRGYSRVMSWLLNGFVKQQNKVMLRRNVSWLTVIR